MFLALDDGDWDLALRIGAEAHNDTVWSAIRDLLVAIVNASRSGPASGAAEAADAAAHRLIAAGDTQWLSSATIAGVVRFLFADYQGVAARQASLLRPGRLRNETVLQSAATGLVAARRAGDDATLRAWQEALERSQPGAGGAPDGGSGPLPDGEPRVALSPRFPGAR